MSLPLILVNVLDLSVLAGVTFLAVDETSDPFLPQLPEAGFTTAMDGTVLASSYDAAKANVAGAAMAAEYPRVIAGRQLRMSFYASAAYVSSRRSFSIIVEATALSIITVVAMAGARNTL